MGQNWYYIKWFGYFFQIPENKWIYHEKLGWFYLDWTTTFESIWLYHEYLGWTWTKADCFPYLFNQEKNIWYYLTENHYFDFKKNNPVSFKSVLFRFMGDWVMYKDMWTGKIKF